METLIGSAHTTGENGKWGKTKQRSENQVAFIYFLLSVAFPFSSTETGSAARSEVC
jgi:hypothetical protein